MEYKVKKVVRGCVEGELVVCPASFAFMGDVDINTSEIIAQGNPNKGIIINGKILVFNETKGSSGGSTVLMTLYNIGKVPAAIISVKDADFNLTEGAILAKVPYACNISAEALTKLKTGQKGRLDLEKGILILPNE
jgi:uncharacterized protein